LPQALESRYDCRILYIRFLITTIFVVLLLPRAAWSQSSVTGVEFELVASGISQPTQVTHAGDGSGRLFVLSQFGEIRVIDGGELIEESFLDIRGKVRCCFEYGLLGLAFHPEYALNGRFFVQYSAINGANVLSSFLVSSDNPNRADPASEHVLLEVPQPTSNHHGGQLQFGPDGMLYVALGDGGVPSAAQNALTLYGKILRIDVNAPNGYAIPPDNPFADTPGARGEVWVYGLRNPWRFSFDRATGDAFIGDVGESAAEEINRRPHGGAGGENYGWNVIEGTDCSAIPSVCASHPSERPIFTVNHVQDNCSALIGGYRYRGPSYPQLNGLYFFGDFCRESITVLRDSLAGWKEFVTFKNVGAITSFGEDEDGELYVTEFGGGSVLKLTAPVPKPKLTQLSTLLLAVGAPTAEIILGGSNIVPGAEGRWNDAPRPTTWINSSAARLALTAEDLATPGTATIGVTNPGPGGGSSDVALEVAVVDSSGLNPSVANGGVVNAASYEPSVGVAPGSIVSVFGTQLAFVEESAALNPLPSVLGAGSVLIDDDHYAALFFSSEGQYNVQVPWDLVGGGSHQLTVRVGAAVSDPQSFELVPYGPALFSADGTGAGQAAAIIAGTASVAAPEGAFPDSRPGRPGEFLTLYGTGLGPVSNTPPNGRPGLSFPLSVTLAQPVVRLQGDSVPVSFSGLAPGYVGLYQINVQIPDGAQADAAAEIELEIGGVRSPSLTVAISAQ
jgi:uncharacterized protein (TIGR03437 family)